MMEVSVRSTMNGVGSYDEGTSHRNNIDVEGQVNKHEINKTEAQMERLHEAEEDTEDEDSVPLKNLAGQISSEKTIDKEEQLILEINEIDNKVDVSVSENVGLVVPQPETELHLSSDDNSTIEVVNDVGGNEEDRSDYLTVRESLASKVKDDASEGSKEASENSSVGALEDASSIIALADSSPSVELEDSSPSVELEDSPPSVELEDPSPIDALAYSLPTDKSKSSLPIDELQNSSSLDANEEPVERCQPVNTPPSNHQSNASQVFDDENNFLSYVPFNQIRGRPSIHIHTPTQELPFTGSPKTVPSKLMNWSFGRNKSLKKYEGKEALNLSMDMDSPFPSPSTMNNLKKRKLTPEPDLLQEKRLKVEPLSSRLFEYIAAPFNFLKRSFGLTRNEIQDTQSGVPPVSDESQETQNSEPQEILNSEPREILNPEPQEIQNPEPHEVKDTPSSCEVM